MIQLKKIQLRDIWKLRRWRNHPDTRQFMHTTHEITFWEHLWWFIKNYFSPLVLLYKAVNTVNNEIGVIRITKENDDYFHLSYVVNPSFRNQGYGTQMLERILLTKRPYKAQTKKTNRASVKLLIKTGFDVLESDNKTITFVHNPHMIEDPPPFI